MLRQVASAWRDAAFWFPELPERSLVTRRGLRGQGGARSRRRGARRLACASTARARYRLLVGRGRRRALSRRGGSCGRCRGRGERDRVRGARRGRGALRSRARHVDAPAAGVELAARRYSGAPDGRRLGAGQRAQHQHRSRCSAPRPARPDRRAAQLSLSAATSGSSIRKVVPRPGLRLDADAAAVALDDAVRDREAEARADADRLGGEERVEDLALDLLGDARPVVVELEAHAVAAAARADADAAPSCRSRRRRSSAGSGTPGSAGPG